MTVDHSQAGQELDLRVYWRLPDADREAIRLVQVQRYDSTTRRTAPLFPPGQPVHLALPDIGAAPCTIVMGEHGGGLLHLTRLVARAVQVEGSTAVALSLQASGGNVHGGLLPDLKPTFPGDLQALKPICDGFANRRPGSVVHQLLSTVQKLPWSCPPCLLMLHGLEVLPKADTDSIMGLIRGGLDFGRFHSQVRLVLTGLDLQAFSTGPFSTLVDRATIYQTPHLTGAELTGEDPHLQKDADGLAALRLHPRVAREVMDWTGGQPLLVKQLLDQAKLDVPDVEQGGMGTDAWLAGLGPWLAEHPPAAELRSWQISLARIHEQEAPLRREIRALVRGDRLQDVGRNMLPLFVSGWLGLHRVGAAPADLKWGLSRCHRAWGREVLANPARFWKESE